MTSRGTNWTSGSGDPRGLALRLATAGLALAAAVVATLMVIPSRAETCTPAPPSSPTPSTSPSPSPSSSTTPSPSPSGSPAVPSISPLPGIAPAHRAARPANAPANAPGDATATDCSSTISIGVSPPAGVWGTRFTIHGTLSCSTLAIRQGRVELLRRFGQSRTESIAVAETNDEGQFTFTDLPDHGTDYTVRYAPERQSVPQPSPSPSVGTGAAGGLTCGAVSSSAAPVEVRPGIVFNAGSRMTQQRLRPVIFSGTIKPAHPGQKVLLQILASGTWKTVATGSLSSDSTYRIVYARQSTGTLLFRVAYPTQHADHAWNISRRMQASWS